MSGGTNSVEAVKKKIKVLQEQAEEANERAEKLRREVDTERRAREEVRMHRYTCAGGGGGVAIPQVLSQRRKRRGRNVRYVAGAAHSLLQCYKAGGP